MRRKLFIAALCLLILACGGWFTYWRTVANQLEAGLDTWIADRRAQGWTVRAAAVTRGGWSIAARLVVHDFEVAGGPPSLPGGIAWLGSGVELRVDLLDPWRVTIHPQGLQLIRLPNGATLSILAETLAIELADAGPRGVTLDANATVLRAEEPDSGSEIASAAAIEAQVTWQVAAGAGEPAATLTLTSKDIHLPETVRWPLGPRIETIAGDGRLTGPLSNALGPRQAAAAWRDGGGAVEISIQTLVWGPLNATASATLALDDALQPMGAGTAHITGFQGMFDALGSNGVLTPSAVKAAKAVLSLMAGVPGGRDQQSVDVPLTLQFRTLSMRQIPLALLPELEWPEP